MPSRAVARNEEQEPDDRRAKRRTMARSGGCLGMLVIALTLAPGPSSASPSANPVALERLAAWGGEIVGLDQDDDGIFYVVQGERLLMLQMGEQGQEAEILGQSASTGVLLAGVVRVASVAYVRSETGVKIFAIRADADPRLIGEFGSSYDWIQRDGSWLYAIAGNNIVVFDISAPEQPLELQRWSLDSGMVIEIDEGRLFTLSDEELRAYRRLPGGQHELERSFSLSMYDLDNEFAVHKQHAYMLDLNKGVLVLAVPADAEWEMLPTLSVDTNDVFGEFALEADGDRLLLASQLWANTLIRLETFDITNPHLAYRASTDSLPGEYAIDLRLSGDELVVVSGLGLDRYTYRGFADLTAISAWYSPGDAVRSIRLGSEHLVVMGSHSGLWIYDLTQWDMAVDRAGPRLETRFPVRVELRDFAVVGQMFYLLMEDGLQILDLSEPSQPRLRGRYDGSVRLSRLANVLAAQGNRLWIGWRNDRLESLDVSDPDQPRLVASYELDDPIFDDRRRHYISELVPLQDGVLLALRGRGLVLGSTSSPPAFPILARNTSLLDLRDLQLNDDERVAFVADADLGLLSIGLQGNRTVSLDPIGILFAPGASKLWVTDRLAYLMSFGAPENRFLRTVDVQRPSTMAVVGEAHMPSVYGEVLGIDERVLVTSYLDGIFLVGAGRTTESGTIFLPRLERR